MEPYSITTDNESNGILYEAAYDENNVLCFACDEEKTQKKQYVCPNCGRSMILHKSNNTGRYAKRPHFAHKSDVVDCKAEGVLHQTFKNKLYEILQDHLSNNKPFNFESNCPFFKEQHSDNLLKNVKKVYIEKDLGICRPDILLTDDNEMPYIAVEIVVTHYPEDNPIKYYKDNNIYLYQLNLESFDDLKNIEEKAKHPDYFNYCTRPKCPTCNNYMKKREFTIKETICSDCRKTIRISNKYEDGSFNFGPNKYNSEDLNFALNNSVAFTLIFTEGKWSNRRLDHTCPHCNPLISDEKQDIVFKPLIAETKRDYYCDHCNKINKTNIQKCKKCNQPLTTRTINIYQSKCHICSNPILFADGDDVYRFENRIKPYQFTQEQIDYAIGEGVNIIQIESRLYSNKFNANVCPKCGNYGNDGIYNINNRLVASKEFVFCNCCNPTMRSLNLNTPKTTNKTYCNICGNTMITNTLFIVDAYCYKCKKTMKVAFIQENDGRYSFNFNSTHKDLASSRYGMSFTTYENYPIECQNCKNPISKKDIDKYVSCKEVAHIPVTFCPNKYNISREYTHTIIPHNSNKAIIFYNLQNLHSWCEYPNNNMNEYDIIMLNNENNYNLLIEKLNKYNQIDIHHLNPNAFITQFIKDAFPVETAI